MSGDPEYDDLVRTERQAERYLGRHHYRISESPCCANCEGYRAGTSVEDADECAKANPRRRWSTGFISPLGICDAWARSTIGTRKV